MATLDPEDIEQIVCAMRDHACTRTCPIDAIPAHSKQHETLDRWIANDVRRQERAEKIKAQVYGWGIVAALSSVGTGVYKAANYIWEHVR